MKTEQLLEALIADRAGKRWPAARALVLALAAGIAISLVFFFVELGVRRDIGAALMTWQFDLKIVLVLLVLVLAFGLARDVTRPDVSGRPLRQLLPVLVLALAAIVIELAVLPASAWKGRMVGTNSLICMSMVPVLSLAPLIAALAILRRGAPRSPVLAGAAAGFLAAACGASLYAFHCFDDSPLFVAVWYTLAALPVILIGAVAGRWVLRW